MISFEGFIETLNVGTKDTAKDEIKHVMIFNVITGELEVYDHLPFYFLATDLNVVDLDGDGEYEIVSTSFYGGLYVFNRTFGLIRTFDTPGIPGEILLSDINGDGTLEIIVGMCMEPSPVVAYSYSSFPRSDNVSLRSPLTLATIIFVGFIALEFVLGVPLSILLYRRKKLNSFNFEKKS